MVKHVILNLFEISVTIGILIVAVALLSPLFNKRYTSKMKYWVWLAIAIRLLIPLRVSFMPVNDLIEIPVNNYTVIEITRSNIEGSQFLESAMPLIGSAASDGAYQISVVDIALVIWFIGLSVYLMIELIAWLRFYVKLKKASLLSTNSQVYEEVERIKAEMGIKQRIEVLIWEPAPGPFLMGLFRRKLILPTKEYEAEELELIIRHELTHSKQRDLWYKVLMNVVNGLHWFNPAAYYMKKRAEKDMEYLCDELVTAQKDFGFRKAYGVLILNSVAGRHSKPTPTVSAALGNDAKTLKERIKNIMNLKIRKKGIIALICIMLCIVLSENVIAYSTGMNEIMAPIRQDVIDRIERDKDQGEELAISFEFEVEEDAISDSMLDDDGSAESRTKRSEESVSRSVSEESSYGDLPVPLDMLVPKIQSLLYSLPPDADNSDFYMLFQEAGFSFTRYYRYEMQSGDAMFFYEYDGSSRGGYFEFIDNQVIYICFEVDYGIVEWFR